MKSESTGVDGSQIGFVLRRAHRIENASNFFDTQHSRQPLFAFGIGSLFTLMMSMTADVCDLNELDTGNLREGLLGAIYWWMVKFGFAIAGLFSGLILSLVGFDQNVTAQTVETLQQLKLAYIMLPMSGTAIALAVMTRYDLSEQKAHAIRQALEARRGVRTGA